MVVFRNMGGSSCSGRAISSINRRGPVRPRVVDSLYRFDSHLGIAVGPSIASAQKLNLTWVDKSGGQASFIIQRAAGVAGPYTEIARVPVGVVSHTDTAVSPGTTYCYQVAATNSTGVSPFSNAACGAPAAGFAVTVATTGTGAGAVVSSPVGITCPGTCLQSYGVGAVLTLTATPVSGSSFSGWSGGGCAGTAPCVFTGNTPVTVTAAFSLNSTAPTPSITSLSPSSVMAGSPAFSLAVTGSGFVSGATATVGGQPRTVTFGSATQMTIAVQAADVASQGSVTVHVSNPAPCAGGLCTSNNLTLTVTAPTPAPTLSSISPTSAIAGGPAFTLTATGANFTSNSVVQVNGSPRTTTFVSATQLTAAVLGGDIAAAGASSITVVTPAPGGGTSSAKTLTVLGPSLTVDSASIAPGGSVTATVTNSPGGSTDWLTMAQVGTSDTTYLQWVYVGGGVTSRPWTVTMPTTPGQYEFRFYPNNGFVRAATSPAVTVVTVNPTPSISSLSPSSVVASGAAFALTVNGNGFVSGATATVGGQPRTVAFGSATQLTVGISAADVASPGPVAVQISNPAPCAGNLCTSNSVTLSVTAPTPAPTLSSLSPSAATAGGGAFTLTAAGSNFTSNSVLRINGAARFTTFLNATQLTVTVLASDIAAPGTPSITVFTPAPGGGTSAAITLSVNNPAPTLASLSPSSVTAGGAAFPLTITGTKFVASSVVQIGGAPRATTFVSSTQLTAGILAADITSAGSPSITVVTPAPGGGATGALALSVNSPAPTLSTLSPNSVVPGGPAFSLAVTGTGFTPTSVVQVNGATRATSFVNATQLTASIPAADIAAAGTPSITVVTPAPGGGSSNAQMLSIAGTSLAVNTTTASPGAPLTATLSNPSGTPNDWIALAAVGAANPSYFQWTFVAALPGTTTKTWTVPLPTTPGQYEVRFFQGLTYKQTATSPTITVANINPTPSLTGLAPASVVASGPGFTLTVSGSGFVSGATATVGGQARTVTVNSPTQLSIAVIAGDVASQGNVAVQVTNPAACASGLCASNTILLGVTAPLPAPTLSSLSSSTVARGGAGFTLTATGTNFVPSSVVQLNGMSRPTSYVSPTQLTATIPASDIASARTASLTVVTPAPGGGTSNAMPLTITGPALIVSAALAPPGTSITATLSNLPGTTNDWIALAAVGAPNSTYLQYAFVRTLPGSTPKTWAFNLPVATGQYEVRFFQGLTYNRAATSPTIVVAANAAPLSPADLAPTVAVNVTSVAPGASLTATLSNLPGTANDWIALSAVGAPSPLYFQYAFVSTLPGSTTKTWTVALPTAPGQYEVRLFQGLTYNRVAISPVITVGN